MLTYLGDRTLAAPSLCFEGSENPFSEQITLWGAASPERLDFVAGKGAKLRAGNERWEQP